MSGRSSRHSVAALVLLCAACGKKAPEADPAKVEAIAKVIVPIMPPLAGVRKCVEADYDYPALTWLTALDLSKEKPPDRPEYERWINPPEIDSPSFRVLLESKDETARRRAAALLLREPQWMVFRVDMVNVPLALGIKELKRGAVGMRAVGVDKLGNVVCVRSFTVQNDEEKANWAMKMTTRPTVDPAVAKELRDDLTVQVKQRISEIMGGD